LIRKYLNGELDAAAMYKLERQAQDDPVLMDMIQGMEYGDPAIDNDNLLEINQRINKRLQNDSGHTRKLIAWKSWTAAASLVLISTVAGLWIFKTPQQNKIQDKLIKQRQQLPAAKQSGEQNLIVQDHTSKNSTPKVSSSEESKIGRNGQLSKNVQSALVKNSEKLRSGRVGNHPVKAAEPTVTVIPDSAMNGNLAALDMNAKSKNASLNEVSITAHYPKLNKKAMSYSTTTVLANPRDTLTNALAGKAGGVQVDDAARPLDFGKQELNEVVVTRGFGATKGVVPAILKPSILGKAHPVIGWDAFKKYLKENAVIPGALVSGYVTVAFMIDRNGDPVRVIIIKPLSGEADRIAAELIRNGPKWTGDEEELKKIITLKIKFRY